MPAVSMKRYTFLGWDFFPRGKFLYEKRKHEESFLAAYFIYLIYGLKNMRNKVLNKPNQVY